MYDFIVQHLHKVMFGIQIVIEIDLLYLLGNIGTDWNKME